MSIFGLFSKQIRLIYRNTDEINEATFTECRLFVIPYPRAKFSLDEVIFTKFSLNYLITSAREKVATCTKIVIQEGFPGPSVVSLPTFLEY